MNITMMSRSRKQLSALIAIAATGLMVSCATEPPPLPPDNAAEPHVRGSARTPRNLLAHDETSLAIERQLSATEAYAGSAEKMEHDMGSMPGMQHGNMQHEPMQDHQQMQPKTVELEKKALSDEMKKTSNQMKQTSEALKQKTEELKTAKTIYTCRMHPQVHSDKPGNCPICGMKLVPKKEDAHEGH